MQLIPLQNSTWHAKVRVREKGLVIRGPLSSTCQPNSFIYRQIKGMFRIKTNISIYILNLTPFTLQWENVTTSNHHNLTDNLYKLEKGFQKNQYLRLQIPQ